MFKPKSVKFGQCYLDEHMKNSPISEEWNARFPNMSTASFSEA
jgi:hypothetical protein